MFGSQPYALVVENLVPTLKARKQAVKNSERYNLKNKIIYDKKFIAADRLPGELILLEMLRYLAVPRNAAGNIDSDGRRHYYG